MKNCIYCLIVMLAGTASSCKQKTAYEKAVDHELKIDSAYCTNDVRAAEKVLLTDLKTISEYEKNRVGGYDFDMAKATRHERLFLIYRKTHETNKMEFEFEQSLECINRSNQRRGLPPPIRISYEEFAKKLEKADSGLNVRWMTNDLHLGNN